MIKEDLTHIYDDFFAQEVVLVYDEESITIKGIIEEREVEEEKMGEVIFPKKEIIAYFLLSEIKKKIMEFDYKKISQVKIAEKSFLVDNENPDTGFTNMLGEFFLGLKNA